MADRIHWGVFFTRMFWKLLGKILWLGLQVAVPLALAFLIPPWAALPYWLLALVAARIEFSLRGEVVVADMWLFAANVAIAVAAGRILPDAWFRWPGALAALIAAFALSEWLRGVLRMPRRPNESVNGAQNKFEVRGKSKTSFPLEVLPILARKKSGVAVPLPGDCFTLAGNIDVKVIDVIEERFGPPRDIDYLIDGHVLLPACSASSRLLVSPDSRYIVAVIRYGDGLMIFDRHEDMLYKIATDAFWELYSIDDESITGVGRRANVPPQRARIDDMIAVAEHDPLISASDFKVPRSYRGNRP